jgi:hypothetical protein
LSVDRVRLYGEVVGMENAIQGNNLKTNYSSQVYERLSGNGQLGRIPAPLRAKIIRLYEQEGEIHGYVLPLSHRISILVPQEVTKLRSAEGDRAWTQQAVAQLNAVYADELCKGSFPMAQFKFNHTGSPAMNTRSFKIASPGSITWLLPDWMEFPKSASAVSAIWPRTYYLAFDESKETWEYRITQDDLDRKHVTLADFLYPVYRTLANDPDFQKFSAEHNAIKTSRGKLRNLSPTGCSSPNAFSISLAYKFAYQFGSCSREAQAFGDLDRSHGSALPSTARNSRIGRPPQNPITVLSGWKS